jgi:hypothetical protein
MRKYLKKIMLCMPITACQTAPAQSEQITLVPRTRNPEGLNYKVTDCRIEENNYRADLIVNCEGHRRFRVSYSGLTTFLAANTPISWKSGVDYLKIGQKIHVSSTDVDYNSVPPFLKARKVQFDFRAAVDDRIEQGKSRPSPGYFSEDLFISTCREHKMQTQTQEFRQALLMNLGVQNCTSAADRLKNKSHLFLSLSSKVTDISLLGLIPHVEQIKFSGGKSLDTKVLKLLPRLTHLEFDRHQGRIDFETLAQFQNLISLAITRSKLGNLADLSLMLNLKSLDLSGSIWPGMPALPAPVGLKILTIRGSGLTYLPNIYRLRSLRKIDMSDNNIENIEGLFKLERLRTVNIKGNGVKQVPKLGNKHLLEDLALDDNKIGIFQDRCPVNLSTHLLTRI